jgi:YVTN family beta-propeller protein
VKTNGQTVALSKREREVALLVAEGLTNREIAAIIFVSERTVEGHVEHIRNKLGCRSRAEVGIRIARHPELLDRVAPVMRAMRPRRAKVVPGRLLVGGALLAALVAASLVAELVLFRHPAPVVLPNTLARLDVASARFVSVVATGRHPDGVALGGGYAWFINYDDQTLNRVDLHSDTVGNAIGVGGTPTGIAYGNGAVWVTLGFGTTQGQSGSVVRFDPVTEEAGRPIYVGDGAEAIAVDSRGAAGHVWIADENDDQVVAIDPATSAVTLRIPVGQEPSAVAVGDGSLWVANTLDSTVWRLDPDTGRVLARIGVPDPPSALAVGPQNVWIASRAASTVTELDAAGNIVGHVSVDSAPSALAIADVSLWVACGTAGHLVKLDPQSLALMDTISVPGDPEALVADASDLWVAVSPR